MKMILIFILSCFYIYANADIDSEINEINSLLKITPRDPELYFQRGYLYYNIEKYDRAIEDLEKCVRFEPNDKIYYFYLAKSYMKGERIRDSINTFQKCVRLNDYAEAYFYLGILYSKVHENSSALTSFDRAIEINSNEAKYWAGRARLKRDIVNINEAIDDYNKALEIDPGFVYAHFDLVWINIEQNNINLALQHARVVNFSDMRNPIYCDTLACAYSEINIKKAIEFELKAIEFGGDLDCKQKLKAFKNGKTYLEYKRENERIEKERKQQELIEKVRRERIWEEIVEKNKEANKKHSR
jgi:tetratricopeptide (TPR) repeat protein